MTVYTFAYRFLDREWHRGRLVSNLPTAEVFAEKLAELPQNEPTDEIRVWTGDDTERAPDATVRREVRS
ncbi:hypothetical protein Ade02nite_20290 [Paractinoplanes deccanensis]|uniref:Uncharacterized protein n=1 Tax=Paractinoplanes deccanensis TaxID=113561 RepID=A0ABQ3Y060_9ACTN|nr:hypothetical protein [Actinoplanes deccanensis]GID73388.1 hypothetical protein Ade02nite_20290 [Actinoplanes deccanensis]